MGTILRTGLVSESQKVKGLVKIYSNFLILLANQSALTQVSMPQGRFEYITVIALKVTKWQQDAVLSTQ